MYNIRFEYYDGTAIDCKDVNVVKRIGYNEEYSGERILTSYYPVSEDYWIQSSNASYSICCKNLKSILITKA